jgi:novel plant SNARE
VDSISTVRDVNEKYECIEKCKVRIRAAGGTKRSFKMEIRLVQDVGQRRSYEARLQQLDQQLQTISADVKAIETELSRTTLFDDAADTSTMNPNSSTNSKENDAVKVGDTMLREASAIQDKTQDSLLNTKKMIAESKEIGVSTLEELQRQREVLTNIDRETDRLDDNLARAEALLKAFGKRMAGDHLIQCFTLINILLLVGVVLYSIIKGGGIGSSDAPAGPPNADGSNTTTTTTDGTRRQRFLHEIIQPSLIVPQQQQEQNQQKLSSINMSDKLAMLLYGTTNTTTSTMKHTNIQPVVQKQKKNFIRRHYSSNNDNNNHNHNDNKLDNDVVIAVRR